MLQVRLLSSLAPTWSCKNLCVAHNKNLSRTRLDQPFPFLPVHFPKRVPARTCFCPEKRKPRGRRRTARKGKMQKSACRGAACQSKRGVTYHASIVFNFYQRQISTRKEKIATWKIHREPLRIFHQALIMPQVCVVGAERGVSEPQTTHPSYVRLDSRRSRAEEEARIRIAEQS